MTVVDWGVNMHHVAHFNSAVDSYLFYCRNGTVPTCKKSFYSSYTKTRFVCDAPPIHTLR